MAVSFLHYCDSVMRQSKSVCSSDTAQQVEQRCCHQQMLGSERPEACRNRAYEFPKPELETVLLPLCFKSNVLT